MKELQYILEGKTPVPCNDMFKWSKFMGEPGKTNNRIIASTFFNHGTHSQVHISTVFLGIDQSFSEEGAPILFETMIFGGKNSDFQQQYETWEMAEAGHRAAVELAEHGINHGK